MTVEKDFRVKLCTKCVTPETSESALFDEGGVCSVCHQIDFKINNIDWEQRNLELDELIAAHRGKYDYDCIVPFSGGKDSTYTLWYLSEVKKLKCLVVSFDHGFYRPTLIDNRSRTLKLLGQDFIQFTPNWKLVRKLMYESLVRRGDFCWHCHTGIFSFPMHIALKFNVPLIFWGEPTGEYASFYSYDEKEEVNEERFNRFTNLGITAEDMKGMLDDRISDYIPDERDFIPYSYPQKSELRALKCKSVLLGHFIPWDVKSQVSIIKEKLDWKGDEVEGVPPEYDYEKIECFMQGVRDYLKFLKRGIGRTNHLVGIDIRNGRKSREEGLALMDQYDGKRPASLDLFLDFLGITEDEFEELAQKHTVSPNKWRNQRPEMGEKTWDFDKWSK
ncbi:N-acetyl sugar amidotransferase [SAR116 cluster bacterium]|nr:N-acetyl sugar amidotransferase [SAR116 cluster bacterium]